MSLKFTKPHPAVLRFGPVAYEVLRTGNFVTCVITGQPIKLEDLRYWSVARQQPYSSAAVSFSEYLKDVKGPPTQ